MRKSYRAFSSWFALHRNVLTNASSLLGTTLVSSALGFAYWWLAARSFSLASVGLASAAISAMMLLGTLAVFGFGTLLMGELSRQPDKVASLISTALTVAIVAGTGTGLLFGIAAPYVLPEFQPVGQSPLSILLFGCGTGLTALGLVMDQAVIGLLRGQLQFWRNLVFSGAKLVVLLALGLWIVDRDWWVIYAAWAAGNLVSFVVLVGITTSNGARVTQYQPRWETLRALIGGALRHHGLNLALQTPIFGLPVLVTALLSASTNAYFYVAWMMAGLVFAGPVALTTTLYAANAADTTTLARRLRLTLGLSLMLGLLANAVLAIAAGPVLNLFGSHYAEQATTSLRILAFGVFPFIVKYHYVALRRIYNEVSHASTLVALGAFLELGLAAAGGLAGGLWALCVGWTLAVWIEAFILARPVLKALSGPSKATRPHEQPESRLFNVETKG